MPVEAPTDTTIKAKISSEWNWLTHHAVLLIIVGTLVLASVYGIEALQAKHDAQKSSEYAAILAAQTAQTATLQQQQQADEARFAQIEAQLLAQNAQLTAQITTRNQAVAAQVKTDATLSAVAAAERITIQTQAMANQVVAENDTVRIDLPIARVIVTDLDLLPVAQFNLADTEKQLANETQIATDAKANVDDAKKVIASQVTQLADADKACKAEVATVKAQARKSKLKWFGIGFVLGYITGHVY